jgi:polysaccharide biosynthesis transport protein
MSLIQFLRILVARRAILLAALLSCFIVALVMTQILPKRYEATARVMLDTVTPDPVTGVAIGSGYRAFVKTQTELIEDEQTAGRVVDKLGWAGQPELISQYARETNGQGNEIRRWLAQQIVDVTKAQVIEPSNIIEIKYSSSTPDVARQIAGMIREVYIDTTIEMRRDTAGRNADWYAQQTEKAKLALTAAEAERAQFAKANGIAVQPNSIDVESAKLATLTGQSASASSVLQTAAPTPLPPPGGASLQLAAINQQIAQAGQTLGPNHPTYQALTRQKTVVEGEVAREKALIAQAAKRPSTSAAVAQIDAAYNAQKTRVIAQRETLDKLDQFNRDISVKQDQYLKSAQRVAQLRLESSTAETTITPLGEATVPDEPTSPRVTLILFGALAFGLALGVGLALLVELLGRRVRSDEDLEYAAKVPVFAIVGQPQNPNSAYRRIARMIKDRATNKRLRDTSEAVQ